MPYCYQRGDYYRGDYYRGDYYRGDGILSAVGKFVGGVAKGVVSLLPGPAGAVLRGVTGVGRGSVALGPTAGPAGIPGLGYLPPPGGSLPISQYPVGPQQPVGTMLPGGFVQQCGIKGTRPNKSGYYRQAVKGNPESAVYIPKGSVCVKTRRLNVANVRALRKAIRRATGFAKLSRRVLSFVQAKAPKGRPRFKRKR
jgi:hypothetical protein